jgi:WD40 repeat protein
MKYEIVHDIIANQVFRKASEVQRRRQQIKKQVEGYYGLFIDDRKANTEGVAGLLNADILRKLDAYRDEIGFTPEVTAYIADSRAALATANEVELARISKELENQIAEQEREAQRTELNNALQQQIIVRTRIAVVAMAAVGLLMLFVASYSQSVSWRAKASEAVAQAVRALNVDGNITLMYKYASEAIRYDLSSPKAQQQLYESVYDSDRQHLLYYTNINSDAEILPEAVRATSSTERYFALPANDSTLAIYDITMPKAQPIFLDSARNVLGIAFSKDDRYVAVASANTLRIYNVYTHKKIKDYTFASNDVLYIAANKDHSFTVVGKKWVARCSFLTNKRALNFALPNDLPLFSINAAEMSNDGRFLILESGMGIRDVFVLFFTPKGWVQLGAIDNVVACNFDATSNQLLAMQEATIKQYNLTGEPLIKADFELQLSDQKIEKSTLISNCLVTSYSDVDSVFGFTPKGILPLGCIEKSDFDGTANIEYSAAPDANYLLFSYKNKGFLYNKAPFISSNTKRQLVGHITDIVFRQVLPQRNAVLTLSADGNIKVWSIQSPCVFDLNQGDFIQPILHTEFSNSERYILTVADKTNEQNNHNVLLWATDAPQQPLPKRTAASLPYACFSPDNRYMITPMETGFEFYDLAADSTQYLSLKANILWCKRAESGKKLLAITHTGCLVQIDIQNKNRLIDTIALSLQLKNNILLKNILKINTSIDSAQTSTDGRYILIFTQKQCILLDSKAPFLNPNHIVIAEQTPLALRFSPQNDQLLVAANDGLRNIIIKKIQTNALKTTRDVFTIKTKGFEPNTLQYGNTTDFVLYKQSGRMYIYRFNTKENKPLNTDYLAYTASAQKWFISFANKVSHTRQPNLFSVQNDLGSAIKRLDKATIATQKEGKKRDNHLTEVVAAQDGEYWAILQNDSDDKGNKNIYKIYDKKSALIAQLSTLQMQKGKQQQNLAELCFSPKGNYILTKSTEKGVKLWYWNINLIKKRMEPYLEK